MPVIENNKTFKNPSLGLQIGILYKIIDIGTRRNEFKGVVTHKRTLIFNWELPEETTEDGKPLTISKFVPLASGAKAGLTKIATASIGISPSKGFDPVKLLGSACNLDIVNKTREDGSIIADEVKIGAFVQLKRNEKAPAPYNELSYFDLDNFDQAQFDSLSDGLRGMVAESPEYAEIKSGSGSYEAAKAGMKPVQSEHVDLEDEDTIPF